MCVFLIPFNELVVYIFKIILVVIVSCNSVKKGLIEFIKFYVYICT